MAELSETVLQLGAGRFLRAFCDRFIHQANASAHPVGKIVVVQSTAGSRADSLASRPEGYSVLVRGFQNGEPVERIDPVASISRALVAGTQWSEVQTLAQSDSLKFVISNATEAGYRLADGDAPSDTPPSSLPGKLTQLLHLRYAKNLAPLVMLPCELIESNGAKLRDLVIEQARSWSLGDAFVDYVTNKAKWVNSLVDCIVTSPEPSNPHLVSDPNLVCAEPYQLWAQQPLDPSMPQPIHHPAIRWVSDLSPFYLRKVRILNGLHTAMVAKFFGTGPVTVADVLADHEKAKWLRALLFEEIVPTIAHRVSDVAEFADQTWDRFRNVHLNHQLKDISLNHVAKLQVRLAPTADEYQRLFGCRPAKLDETLARKL